MVSGLSKREERILDLLAEGQDTSVSGLSSILGVSQVTVRNDLKNLDSKGLVVKTHGSALYAGHPQIAERQNANSQQKEAIAKAAAQLVRDGDSLMVCNGTTVALVVRYLLGKKNISVVTNSLLLLPYARVNGGLNVTFVGGEYRAAAEALSGPEAARQIRDYHVKTAFLGTDGLTIEHGLTTGLPENAEIVRSMCSQADKTVLVVDSSKFGNKGFVKILNVDDVDVIITDSGAPQETLDEIRNLGVEVIVVETEKDK